MQRRLFFALFLAPLLPVKLLPAKPVSTTSTFEKAMVFGEGIDAFKNGLHFDEGPYDFESENEKWSAWVRGWIYAQKAHYMRQIQSQYNHDARMVAELLK